MTLSNQNERRQDDSRPEPACSGLTNLFFGPEDDGRMEEGREEREALAKSICSTCPYLLPCLERAMVHRFYHGVFGGMGEGERREFRQHLNAEGYGPREVPEGDEFLASVLEFYRSRERRLA